MFIITDAAAMAATFALPLDPRLKRRLALRRDQLLSDTAGDYDLGDLVQIVVVEPTDCIDDIERRLGFPLFTDPAFEWVEHCDGWFEAVVILSDDGFGIAIFTPDAEVVDPTILAILRDRAGCESGS